VERSVSWRTASYGIKGGDKVGSGPLGEHRVPVGVAVHASESVLVAVHAAVESVLTGETEIGVRTPTAAYRISVGDGSWRELIEAVRPVESDAAIRTLVGSGALDSADYGIELRDGWLVLAYRPEKLDPDRAARIAGYHAAALQHAVTDPDGPHRDARLLSEQELTRQLSGIGYRHRELPDRRAHELIEDQARRQPDAVAAVLGPRTLTYGELNRRANRIAHALLARELTAGAAVAVVTERNLDWLASVLAVFKAGGVYLPVEPHFPPERMATMLRRAECRLALTEPGSRDHLDKAGLPVETLDVTGLDGPDSDPGIPVGAGQPAYVYFTSGSTGEPKGAVCGHLGLVNHLYAKIDDLGIGPGQTVAQTAPQCFDISLWQLIAGLVVGARTLIVPQEVILDARRFVDTLVDGRVEVVQVVPSYLEMVLSHLEERPRELPDLRFVSATGEPLKRELLVRWFAAYPGIRILNAYGLTETSDDTNHEVLDRAPARVPLGAAIANVIVSVVDEDLRLVPLGAPGEIVFSGLCVGLGYLNDPERTRAAFGDDPLRPGLRLYRSGDIGRWRPDGKLEFLGRRDAQVKIRGFRIEIGEIENQLLRVPGVRDAAVVIAAAAGKQLVAFYSAAGPLPAGTVLDALAETLPDYMVPTSAQQLPVLPLTGNGKIDKKALTRRADELRRTGAVRLDPETPAERRLAALWARTLGLPVGSIGRDDDFFALGGTSLSAVRLVAALDQAVTLAELAEHPVLSDLAARLEAHPTAPPSTVDRRDAPSAVDRRDTPVPSAPPEPTTAAPATTVPVLPRVPAAARTTVPVLPREPSAPRVPTPRRTTVVTATPKTGAAADWAAKHRDELHGIVAEHGAVLVRGLQVATVEDVRAVSAELVGEPVEEREGFATRHRHGPGLYSSAEWPSADPMCMHHELSYTLAVPRFLLFGCLTAPTRGGATALADGAAMLRALPDDLVDRVQRDGWELRRAYNGDVGMRWQAAFGTDDETEAEKYCRDNGIDVEWGEKGELLTRQRRAGVITHQSRPVWFNQIAFLNEWTMDPDLREFLTRVLGRDRLPFTTAFGDGGPIGPDVVDTILDRYEKLTVREPWQDGDVLLVDNIRMAHSREAYQGGRAVVVAMGSPAGLPGHRL
jgi:amino acid adenylation domain-containing protein